MKIKKWVLIVLGVLVVAVGAFLFINRPVHAQLSAGIIIGEEVMLSSQGTPLAASLVLPEAEAGSGPRPGVVMITGSGSYTYRDSWTPEGFPIWKVVTEAFTAKGYAVLLLEKKGVNRSGGHWETQTFQDRAEDAVVGVRYLRSRPDVDPARVGVCGHSQGGWIAQLAAAEYPSEVGFVVSLAGPNISVKQQVIDDQENEWRCGGMPEDKIRSKVKGLRTRLGWMSAIAKVVKFNSLCRIIDYDPEKLDVAARIKCPVLALYGENDNLVLPSTNAPLLERGLQRGGNARYKIVIVPQASHGLSVKPRKCWGSAGGPAKVEFQPLFLETLAAWEPF